MSEETNSIFTINFQRSILKILASNVQFSANYGTLLLDEYFENHALKTLCSLIKEYVFGYEKEMDLNTLSVEINKHALNFGIADESADVIKKEAKLIMNTHIPSEQFYIDNLVAFVRRQELKNALFKAVEIIERDDAYEQVLHMVDRAVSIGAGNSEEITYADLADMPSRYLKKYDPDKLVKSGFPTWDAALKGGMAPGEVHVILAPPKVGKSSTMVNVGVANLKEGKAVFHITLEISREDVAMKYAMNMSGMSTDQITSMTPEAFKHKLKRYDEYKPNLYINFWPECSINTFTIRSWISRVRSKTGVTPSLIIIDYDDCLLPTTGKSKDDMYNDAGNVYSDLVQLASYFECPVLTAAQPQRDAWEMAAGGNLITHDKLAHSARKAHRCWSISSLNFGPESNDGILYLDITRRGDSKVKVKINKQLERCWVKEAR
jgi:replicative DNA helicase